MPLLFTFLKTPFPVVLEQWMAGVLQPHIPSCPLSFSFHRNEFVTGRSEDRMGTD